MQEGSFARSLVGIYDQHWCVVDSVYQLEGIDIGTLGLLTRCGTHAIVAYIHVSDQAEPARSPSLLFSR